MTKSKKQLVKCIRDAKDALILSIKIDDVEYKFDSNIFDLNSSNIGMLNGQICDIPGHIAFIGTVYSEAEKYLARKELAFDIWKSNKLITYFGDNKIFKSETDKLNNLKKSYAKEYVEKEEELQDIRRLVKILKTYERGMDAKMQLAQTMSANIRSERESYYRDYDKDMKKSKGSF